MPEIWVPPALQRLTGGRRRVQVVGATIRQVVNNLEKEYPGMKARLCEEEEIMPGIAVIVDGEDTALGMLQPVGENSEVHFLQAIGGGAA